MKQAFARLCLTLNSVKYPFLFMTELCWVPGPFVLNIHAVSAAFHWTCLGCQSLAFGQCGTIWKAWVNSWPHGNKKIVSNDSTSEQDVQGSLFNKFAHGCRGCASSISKPKNTFHDHQWFDCFFLCQLSSTNALCFPICSNAHGFQATISQVWVVLSNQTYPPCRRHVHKRGFADRSVPDELKTFTQ